ncbi:hypothetical protein ACT4UL_24815, partial [Bacillus sp. HC-TM]
MYFFLSATLQKQQALLHIELICISCQKKIQYEEELVAFVKLPKERSILVGIALFIQNFYDISPSIS